MAAQNVSGQITLNVSLTEQISAGSTSATAYQIPIIGIIQQTLGNGTGVSGDIDCVYSAKLTLAGAATHINLYSFTDPGGNTVSMARCRGYFLQNLTLTAGYLINLYTRTGTDPVTWLPVTTSGALWAPAGGYIFGLDALSTSTNGWVVGSGAYDFTVDPGANTVSCSLLIWGNTAA